MSKNSGIKSICSIIKSCGPGLLSNSSNTILKAYRAWELFIEGNKGVFPGLKITRIVFQKGDLRVFIQGSRYRYDLNTHNSIIQTIKSATGCDINIGYDGASH